MMCARPAVMLAFGVGSARPASGSPDIDELNNYKESLHDLCCCNVGTPSATLAQHYNNIGLPKILNI